MFKRSIFLFTAVVAIAASAAAEAKPRQHRASAATITCDDRGCSDHRISDRSFAVRQAARVHHRSVRSNVRHAPRAAQAAMARTVRSDVHAVRIKRAPAETGVIVCNQQGCSDRQGTARAEVAAAPAAITRYRTDPNGNDATVLGGRPAGCPHAFCGCEASRYVFGEMRPELYLATNWIRKFPRTMPAPGMAAVRSGHVMVLISHADGNDWLVHDGNSGGGLTRRHVRSIGGYVIVDPQGTRTAQR